MAKMTLYVQQEADTHKVTDIVSYPYGDYTEMELETPLPPKIMGGAYKVLGGSIVYVPEWDVELSELQATIDDILVAMVEV